MILINRLFGSLLEVAIKGVSTWLLKLKIGFRLNLRVEVLTVLLLLQATKGHLGAGNVLLGVLKVLEQSIVVPGDTLLLVGVGELVAVGGTRLAAKEAVQVGADLVATVLLDGVALSTTGLEEVGTLLNVTCREKRLSNQTFIAAERRRRDGED